MNKEMRFSDEVLAKYHKMKEKSEFCHATFLIPESEKVIQDYRCKMKRGTVTHSGRIWITHNYILFQAKGNLEVKEPIPFYRISNVTYNGSLFSKSISIDTDTGDYLFAGFYHSFEAFSLIEHLWQYPPTYCHLTEEQLLINASNMMNSFAPKEEEDIFSGGKIDPKKFKVQKDDDDFGKWSSLHANIKQDQLEYEKVDLAIGDKNLQIGLEIRDIGVDILNNLESQAEITDRVQRNVKETKNNLDRGDRILDGIDSVAGQVKNLVTPDLYKNKLGAYEAIDRSIDVRENENFIDVPILMKHSNDSLEKAMFRFGNKRFVCCRMDGTEVKDYEYHYEDVQAIYLRARHQHLDIRFHNGIERFRCCTSFVQAVVNEIVLRTRQGQVSVVYEPGVKEFQYGSMIIRSQSLKSTRGQALELGDDQIFFSVPKADHSQIIDKAPEDVKDKLTHQDKQINDLQSIVGDINAIANAITDESERQIQQLQEIHNDMDKAIKKAHVDDFRVKKLL